MRKIREVLRLSHEHRLSNRAIARALQCSPSTVHEVLRRAKEAGISWPLPEELDDTALEERLYRRPELPAKRPVPNWEAIHAELRKPGVTLQLLWEEYRQAHPDGWGYTQFCVHYREWLQTVDPVMRQTYRPGEKCFVDYAGQTIPIYDPGNGHIRFQAHIFVAVLGASNYTFVEAHPAQDLPHWIQGHVHAFEFFGGVPQVVVPDNTKTAVSHAHLYDPDLNPVYAAMASHYGTVVLPARPHRPRDKAKVETAVQVVERSLLAPLRNEKFFSLEALNQALTQRLRALNERPFQKMEGSRASLFAQTEQPALRPLPENRFVYTEWRRAKVHPDYHVQVNRNFYSVPYSLVGQMVDVLISADTVEIFHHNRRIALHPRQHGRGQWSTQPHHRSPRHLRLEQWTPERMAAWGQKVGPATAELVTALFSAADVPERALRTSLGLLRLCHTYGAQQLEAACRQALNRGKPTYKAVERFLKESKPNTGASFEPPPVAHANIRGPEYYRNTRKEDSFDAHASDFGSLA